MYRFIAENPGEHFYFIGKLTNSNCHLEVNILLPQKVDTHSFDWLFKERSGMSSLRAGAGDEGYTESRVLLTAIRDANNITPEGAYSAAIRRTRCMVEQTFGILEEVWRCLNKK
ncbi:hypothetical protein QAD02_002599 [Eretmocerus hayati]|uniref:Uncharacterized protein n=1 Tax=Eretmocerus hayati TaxID=131215 RepID=A0ACC2NP95_9HYME|nr:hypothetical protein QAD02_002599 [Eretmocerus hayati]